jgi:hypothetical protein
MKKQQQKIDDKDDDDDNDKRESRRLALNSRMIQSVGPHSIKEYCRSRLATSIRINAPSVVFDFRYDDLLDPRVEKSLNRQLVEAISLNRKISNFDPFQIHFCNYKKDTFFHKQFGKLVSLDNNLIQETDKSYMDIFDKDDLIYLTKDSTTVMREYDPTKVYIIGK